ncbi:hypothetical protein [Undibacterium sp.]|uniref:hypothetical protein n=1 Tax=Undibacterium sp. TaxID=1914977 RepID=UPI0025D42E09|nr:hypothetical protein [Undibacterium sp.]
MSTPVQVVQPSPPVHYTFQVDLSIGGSTPNYQVLNGDFHLPANTMPPVFYPGDTIQFTFIGRPVDEVILYARPLEPSEEPAPFTDDTWEIAIQDEYVLTIGKRRGYWSFTIAGIYAAKISSQYPAVSMPFLVDPEAKVGTGSN